jgi:hypothetical protein
MIAAGHSSPGRMSRGAIQQRTPRDSSTAQAASAMGLSFDEYEMNASNGMAPSVSLTHPDAVGNPGG